MGCDISGSNDNTIDQNLQGAKKKLLLKPLKQPWIYVASYHCGDFNWYSNWKIIPKWLFFIPTNARHPVSIVLGQKAVHRFQKKRPRYMLLTTNVAQPKKNAITKTAPSLDLLFYSRLRKSNQRYTLLSRQNVYPHFWFLGSPAHFALSPFLR